MDRKREPKKKKKPAYPRLSEAKIERRKFITLIGGASATAVLYSACDKGKPADSDNEEGWDDDSIDGEEGSLTDNFNVRLPESDYQAVTLICGTEILYCIWMSYTGASLSAEDKTTLLDVANDVLDNYAIDAINDDDMLSEIETEIKTEFDLCPGVAWMYNISLSLEFYESDEDGGVDAGPDAGDDEFIS